MGPCCDRLSATRWCRAANLPDEEAVKVADFGARLLSSESSEGSKLASYAEDMVDSACEKGEERDHGVLDALPKTSRAQRKRKDRCARKAAGNGLTL